MIANYFYHFIKKNLVYAAALFFERSIAFLLLPLYTYVLPPAEYGVYAVLLSFIAFATFFYGLGIENALLKYSAEKETQAALMGTVFWTMAGSGLFFSVILLALSRPIAILLLQNLRYQSLIQLTAGILFTDTLIRYFLYCLLGHQRTRLYFAASLFRGIVTVLANMVFLVLLKWSLKGVFLSYLYSNLLLMLFMVVFANKRIFFRFDLKRWVKLLRFGCPVMLTSLFITLLNFFDRYWLEIRVSPDEAGLYSAAYRIGFVINMIITAFSMGAVPFASHVLKENPNERRVFSKLMHYSFFVCISVFLFLSLFVHDLAQFKIFGYAIINERYLKAMQLVPVILLSYVFYGFSVNFSLGLYVKEKTGAMAWITFVAFVINLAANWVWIPMYASWGAAAATGLAFFCMAAMLFGYSRRIFPIPYDWVRMFGILGMALFIFIFSIFIVKIAWPIKMVLFLLFVGVQTVLWCKNSLSNRVSRIWKGMA